MTTELTTSKDFQTRMFERIREQIGDLLTEDDMRKMVERCVEQSLFAPVVEERGYNHREVKPSHFARLVAEAAEPMVKTAVQEWMAENADTMAEKIDAIVREGVAGVLVSHINFKFQEPLSRLSSALHSKGLLE